MADVPEVTDRAGEVLAAFLKLGCTSFGGPVAHLGYFRDEFVGRRRWLDERAYADLVALCQFLPGPASSQVALSIGLTRAGFLGALAAWAGFTLPSAIALTLFAYGAGGAAGVLGIGWLNGVKAVAVAVVALATLNMARALAPDRPRATLAVGGAIIALAAPTALGQIAAIALGAIVGLTLPSEAAPADESSLPMLVGRGAGFAALAAFFALLIVLPLAAAATTSQTIKLIDAFYRAGALVFGGGHVVLPLLQAAVTPPGWIGNDAFLAGYGAAQAVPGPLFTFAAYLGAAMGPAPNGVAGAALCLVVIYLPSFLMIIGVLPFWATLRREPLARAALTGVNAGVVGLLIAALYRPVWTAGIVNAGDYAIAVAAFLLLFLWRAPPWLVVVLGAVAGAALAAQ
ncbi:MAG TPA: chromate efflux transporter [Roseiarcus sp.]|jgi:chromate transporter|nr:chromate efflux transporter [Roseiarcus sp.]